jgi:GGDEF domain-containing protein
MDVALQLRRSTESRARSRELAAQLRVAALEGDEVGITHLLADLLRLKWLTKGQRVALQMQALQDLVAALRSAAMNDEATGLCNQRAFVQSAARALDLAVRDARAHHLVYFRLGRMQVVAAESTCPATRLVLVRQMGNFLRDLYPDHGIYEIVGRLGASEFAALTPNAAHTSRESILLRLRRPAGAGELPSIRLEVGCAQFNPARPVSVEELLETARQATQAPARVINRVASSAFPPQTGMTRC